MHSLCKCGHVYAEGVGFLPQDCYKTVRLINTCNTNAHCCRHFLACVHFACRVRKIVQKINSSPLTKLQPLSKLEI